MSTIPLSAVRSSVKLRFEKSIYTKFWKMKNYQTLVMLTANSQSWRGDDRRIQPPLSELLSRLGMFREVGIITVFRSITNMDVVKSHNGTS